jgi:hypothetical protein
MREVRRVGLFKSKEEKAASEADAASKALESDDTVTAMKHLDKSIKKGTKDPKVFVLKQMIEMKDSIDSPETLKKAVSVLQQYQGTTVMYGIHDVSVDRLLRECQLELEAYNISSMELSEEKGIKYIELANKYQMEFGDDKLIIDQVFKKKVEIGSHYFLKYSAIGNETKAQAIKYDKPDDAAIFMGQAENFYKQINDVEKVNECHDFSEGASQTRHCWICGKRVTGRFIHFVPVSTFMTKPILDQCDHNTPQPKSDPDHIYLCTACYFAIDGMSKYYYNKSVEYTDQEVGILRSDTIRMINQVNGRIDDLIDQLNRR